MSPRDSAEAVKAALSSGAPQPLTVSNLQTLLSSAAVNRKVAQPTASKSRSLHTASSRIVRLGGRRRAAPQATQIREDAIETLTPKQQYALATETVNQCLAALSRAAKNRGNASSTRSNALQPISGNAEPTCQLENDTKGQPNSTACASKGTNGELVAHSTTVAECARLAFSYLRSVDPQKSGIRAPPELQLETGTVAFINQLLSLGLDACAISELRLLKCRLESCAGSKEDGTASNGAQTGAAGSAGRQTLVSLLDLEDVIADDLQVLQLAINYQLLVLRCITNAANPGHVEATARRFSKNSPTSPANLCLRSLAILPDDKGVAKWLQTLSETILGLCPSISVSADEMAVDVSISPALTSVLRLQTSALELRLRQCNLIAQPVDMQNEVWHAFGRCMKAFTRRCELSVVGDEEYRLGKECYERLKSAGDGIVASPKYDIEKALCDLAESCGAHEEAFERANSMLEACSNLELDHVRRCAASARIMKLQLAFNSSDASLHSQQSLSTILQRPLSGSNADFDDLLFELAQLMRALVRHTADEKTVTALTRTLTSFAQRFMRSYPTRDATEAQNILSEALRWSKTTADASEWITEGAFTAFVQTGTMHIVVEHAASKSLSTAWSVSGSAITLGRVIQALFLRTLRLRAEGVEMHASDQQTLCANARGVILEWQLHYALGLAHRPKHCRALQKVLPDILQKLDNVYNAATYPVRRARVALATLQLQASHPMLLPPHCFEIWQDCPAIDPTNLGQDQGLALYLDDVNAGLAVARAFCTGRPAVSQLKPSLISWVSIVQRSKTRDDLTSQVSDCEALKAQLAMMNSYFAILGEEDTRAAVLRLRLQLHQLLKSSVSDECAAMVELAQQHLALGFSQAAGIVFAQAKEIAQDAALCKITKLQLHVALAEHAISLDDLDTAGKCLREARALRNDVPPEVVPVKQRKLYEICHAQGWLAHSRYLMASKGTGGALASAKQSVRILNSVWSAMERSTGTAVTDQVVEAGELSEPGIVKLTTGVSKLKLTSKENAASSDARQNTTGAAFWPILPLLCQALGHLSDMYANHGLYAEADYYSQRAISVAEEAGCEKLCVRHKICRGRLLLLAGQREDAEVCLEGIEELTYAPLDAIDQRLVRAAIRVKEGALFGALKLYEQADQLLDELGRHDETISVIEGSIDATFVAKHASAMSIASESNGATNVRAKKPPAKSAEVKRRPAAAIPTKRAPINATIAVRGSETSESCSKEACSRPCLSEKLKDRIRLEKELACLVLGAKLPEVVAGQASSSKLALAHERHAAFLRFMRKAARLLQTDVSYNLLPETTLSLPAALTTSRGTSDAPGSDAKVVSCMESSQKVKTGRNKKRVTTQDENVASMLVAARDSLLCTYSAGSWWITTSEAYRECSMLSSVAMMISAVSPSLSFEDSPLTNPAVHLELARINAAQQESHAIRLETGRSRVKGLPWPEQSGSCPRQPQFIPDFQQLYVDILPSAWMAISLCMNEEGTELYVARYRSKQPPFILRLPFSRHSQDEADAEIFDYCKGKSELEDIIQTSNYTCHSSSTMEGKGAKTNWWTEREALDRRLHELLINIEHIWLGGFRSVFSQHRRHDGLLARFRESFRGILTRHLPSRKANKDKTTLLELDDQVLELFIGLGSDQDGAIDLDEPLVDLLYFVVDTLQFHGERNAYDEIDFDGITVDLLDALRSYHEACEDDTRSDQHLILVLEKRLQAFPWENLPCLQGSSVSRVPSMLSLRERIVARRAPVVAAESHRNGENCHHVVSRGHGTYILNPSSDLSSTQTTLTPALTRLSESSETLWTSLVNKVPTEEDFSRALSESPILLYFGHGAGIQYIRPKNIKRLQKCSEVVWLMGCSSGAVTEYGELEPFAVPLAYLMAGQDDMVSHDETVDSTTDRVARSGESRKCMAVVATLWDVTDKDIDRFSLAVGEEWGLWSPSEASKLPAKSLRRREVLNAPSTPQQCPMTPKPPKVKKTPALVKTPSQRRSRRGTNDGRKRSLVEAVSNSRDACYLRYLNGAAPVVYGIPVYLDG